MISRIWERFTKSRQGIEGRVIGVPDAGSWLQLGDNELWLLPAHFMHSEGDFHFWDPRTSCAVCKSKKLAASH